MFVGRRMLGLDRALVCVCLHRCTSPCVCRQEDAEFCSQVSSTFSETIFHWPGAHQSRLGASEPQRSVSASLRLGLQVCTTMPG